MKCPHFSQSSCESLGPRDVSFRCYEQTRSGLSPKGPPHKLMYSSMRIFKIECCFLTTKGASYILKFGIIIFL